MLFSGDRATYAVERFLYTLIRKDYKMFTSAVISDSAKAKKSYLSNVSTSV